MTSDTQLRNEVGVVIRGMEIYGGSFMRAIGDALVIADIHNIRRIHDAWPQDWERYLKMGERE